MLRGCHGRSSLVLFVCAIVATIAVGCSGGDEQDPAGGGPIPAGGAGSNGNNAGSSGGGVAGNPGGGNGAGAGSGGSSGAPSGGSSGSAGNGSAGENAGGLAGSGGSSGVDACGDGEWTCVPVPPTGPYGSHSFDVPAAQNWVNTGLYLKQGQTATVSIDGGEWSLEDEGGTIHHTACLVGDLAARIGLHYEESEMTCISGTATVTADKDGILFLGALASSDLGESYETRLNASGKKTVTVTSTGDTAPTLLGSEAAGYAFDTVSSGWVEVWGEHVILTLPVATASADSAALNAATERLDAIYDLHEELRGGVPMHGQRIRFFPDPNIDGIGWMLAGNPVRMDMALVTDPSETISRAGEDGHSNWGFAHELGHIFSWPNGFWQYEVDTLESWCNLFSLYALGSLELELHDSIADCDASSTRTYVAGSWDPWDGLCFLMQFQYDHGWDVYKTFFRSIATKDSGDMNDGAWPFVHDELEAASGADLTPTFDAWGVPHP
ncbi:MAG TPA: M60 family metallopeptidase [Polyangiaceae bacterium]|nr:M60 family metallopeptidase [Polyangiaceae bacterium]